MIIKFSTEYIKYTNGLIEIEVEGKTLGECVENMLCKFPQLYIHWMDNQAEEGKKSSFYFNDEFIWESSEAKRVVTKDDILFVSKSIPSGSGAVGKMIAGVVLIVAAIALTIWIPGAALTWANLGFWGSMGVMTGVGLIVGGIGELIVGSPKVPSLGDYGATGDNTPTYTFTGIRNTTTIGTPIGLVYGTHRVGGQLLNVYTDIEGTDTYLYAQIGLCEGEITSISDIQINGNPLSFYSDVTLDYRYGASTQSMIPWFTRTENSVSTNALITNTGVQYETSKIVDASKLIISSPQLYHSGYSDIETTTVSFEIYYKKSTDTEFTRYELVNVGQPNTTSFSLSGKTKSETLGEYLVTLPSSDTYTFKLVRLTEDHSSDLKYADTIYLKTVNEINYDQFSYPCTAMLGVKIKATEQLSGSMPTITALVKGQKVFVPNNYDPITHTYSSQTWDGTFASEKQWTDNPIWCLYDLLTNTRYGCGDYYKLDQSKIALIKAQFFLMAKYCDQLVNGEPRYTLNMVIDSDKSAAEWVGSIASIMQASVYYSEGILWVDINRPKPITQLFNMSNIIQGSYSQAGSSYKNMPNVYEIQWPNPDRDYQFSMFRLESPIFQDTRITVEEQKSAMNLVGVTRFSHARRLAKYALLAGMANTKTVTFKTATNALQCMVSDIIGIQHDVPQWGYGARVVSYDEATRTLTLSNDVTINTGSLYDVQISHKGQAPKTYSCHLDAASPRALVLNEIPDPVPEKDDIYIIGETDFSVKPFRVLSLKINTEEEIEIVATEYNESVYTSAEDLSDQSEVLVHSYSSLQSPSKVSVTDFKANEKIYIANDGTIKTGIECFFTPQSNSMFWDGAIINYAPEKTFSWSQLPVNKSGYVFIPDLVEQITYEVVATSVFKDGSKQSVNGALADEINRPFATVTLLGKTAPPANVTNFVVKQNETNNNYLKFTWKPVEDIDLSHYEIRKGSSWQTGEIIKDYIKETYYNEFFISKSATYSFMIKAVDTSGNYSDAETVAVIAASVEPQTVSGFSVKQVGNAILLTWNANPELDIMGYTIREGESWDASMVIVENSPNTNFTLNGVSNRTYKFWIKAIDLYGSESIKASPANCNVTNIPLTNIYMTFDESASNWAGVKENVTINSGHLSLPALYTYDSGLLYDSGILYDSFSTGTGYYTTPTYNLGAVINANFIFDYDLTIGSGDVVKIEIATSDGTLATWDDTGFWDMATSWEDTYIFSDWVPFTGGYITAKYFKIRITLVNTSGLLSIATFKTYVDVPDVTLRGSGVAVPAEGLTIPFSYQYYAVPSVGVTVLGTDGYPRMISRTNTNFTIKVYNSSNVAISGVIDWIANGY